jgi:hypothetical protein
VDAGYRSHCWPSQCASSADVRVLQGMRVLTAQILSSYAAAFDQLAHRVTVDIPALEAQGYMVVPVSESPTATHVSVKAAGPTYATSPQHRYHG